MIDGKQKIDKAGALSFIETLRARGDYETLAKVAVVTVEGLCEIQGKVDDLEAAIVKAIAERTAMNGGQE